MRSTSWIAAVAVAAILPGSAMAQQPTIAGTDGADHLRGTPGPDRIHGNGGRDRIDGGAGRDRIDGGGGRDVIRCGDGRDYVLAERQDVVSDDCETVTFRRSLTDEIIDASTSWAARRDGRAPAGRQRSSRAGRSAT